MLDLDIRFRPVNTTYGTYQKHDQCPLIGKMPVFRMHRNPADRGSVGQWCLKIQYGSFIFCQYRLFRYRISMQIPPYITGTASGRKAADLIFTENIHDVSSMSGQNHS